MFKNDRRMSNDYHYLVFNPINLEFKYYSYLIVISISPRHYVLFVLQHIVKQ